MTCAPARLFIALALFAFAPAALAGTPPASAKPSIFVVALGLSNESNVFRKEATKSARIVADSFAVSGEPVVRANYGSHSGATMPEIRQVLKNVGARMGENDILFLILTSHGNRNGAAITSNADNEFLSPARLSSILSVSHIKRRVIVVSACYSGVFGDLLADPQTLVISAADSWHPSFGCGVDDEWTYFGEAFFSQALAGSDTLTQAFQYAAQIVYWRELWHGFDHSNPQMSGGEAILPLLRIRHAGAQKLGALDAPQSDRSGGAAGGPAPDSGR